MGEADEAIATRARLLAYHSRNNSMGRFYEMYPDERPNEAVRNIARKLSNERSSKTTEPRDRGELER
jgi:hypothetical protein